MRPSFFSELDSLTPLMFEANPRGTHFTANEVKLKSQKCSNEMILDIRFRSAIYTGRQVTGRQEYLVFFQNALWASIVQPSLFQSLWRLVQPIDTDLIQILFAL